jgi:hypothetical protein
VNRTAVPTPAGDFTLVWTAQAAGFAWTLHDPSGIPHAARTHADFPAVLREAQALAYVVAGTVYAVA